MIQNNKPYREQLNDEYSIPLPSKSFEEASDEEIHEWFLKAQEQSKFLIDNYGESSWNILELANTLRNEDISESKFRDLVRKEMDKCFKRLNNER